MEQWVSEWIPFLQKRGSERLSDFPKTELDGVGVVTSSQAFRIPVRCSFYICYVSSRTYSKLDESQHEGPLYIHTSKKHIFFLCWDCAFDCGIDYC